MGRPAAGDAWCGGASRQMTANRAEQKLPLEDGHFRFCEGFRMPAPTQWFPATLRAGVRKPPEKEPALRARRSPMGICRRGGVSGRCAERWRRWWIEDGGRRNAAGAVLTGRFGRDGRRNGSHRQRRDGSGAAPGARCCGGRMLRRGGDGDHGFAVLTPALDEGGPRGAVARSKTSTMIMRPPQHGQGGRWSLPPT